MFTAVVRPLASIITRRSEAVKQGMGNCVCCPRDSLLRSATRSLDGCGISAHARLTRSVETGRRAWRSRLGRNLTPSH